MVKSETRRDAETLVTNPSPRLFGKKFRDSKKVKTNHANTRLRDLSKTLPRFRDPVKIFRDQRLPRYHSPPLMNFFLEESQNIAYGHTQTKARLKEYFGDQIIITDINGKSNVVTLRSTAECVLQEFHDRQEDDPDIEKIHLIKTAAKLIRNDIKSVGTSNEHYPPSYEIESQEKSYNFLPTSVKVFLEGIIMGKDVDLKRASIGQAIISYKQLALEFYLHRCRLDWMYNFITTLTHNCLLTRSIV